MNILFPPGGLTLAHVAGYAVLSFILTVIVTRPLIDWLKARQFGKAIRVDGPDHAAKAGTPTMGGLGMLAVIGGLGLVLAYQVSTNEETAFATRNIVLVLIAMVGYAVLGLLDDLAGLARKSGKRELGVGLTARRMIVLQVLLACALSFMAAGWNWLGGANAHSIWDVEWLQFGFWSLLVTVIVLVGTVNGVNFSDGLDGLAAGLLAIAFAWLAVLTLLTTYPWRAQFDMPFVALAMVVAGACAGFLVFNRHPAQLFMGNVTSMGLGAVLAMWSLNTNMILLLPIVGAVFVAEVASDIIQIGYFKWTGGKRFFRMAPLHHHFEKGGMSETQVVRRFWAAGALAGLFAAGFWYLLLTLARMLFPPITSV